MCGNFVWTLRLLQGARPGPVWLSGWGQGGGGEATDSLHQTGVQEADIQDLRKKLLESGKFDQDLLEAGDLPVLDALSDDVSPVLMEVLQASARVSVPDAAKQRVWELCEPFLLPCPVSSVQDTAHRGNQVMRASRRKQAGLPPLPDAELVKAIRRLHFGSVALDLVPASMTLSRQTSWKHARKSSADAAVRFASRYEQTPEQQLLAKRQLALGLRTAAYGTMATALVLGGGVTLLAWQYGLRDWDDCKVALKECGQSFREPIRARIEPWRAFGERLLGRDRGGNSSA